jgi:hypothetical protein
MRPRSIRIGHDLCRIDQSSKLGQVQGMQKRLSNGFISDTDRLQPHLAVVLLLVLSAGCGQNQREEVTGRYSTGEKKKVLTYEGQGAEEELIKRQIHARSGTTAI